MEKIFEKLDELIFVLRDIVPGGGAEKQALMQAQCLINSGLKVKFICRTIDTQHFYKYCPSGSYSTNWSEELWKAKGKLVISFLTSAHRTCAFFALLRWIRWIPFERTHPGYYDYLSEKKN